MMEAARTSETSVNIDLRTQQYIPEDSELHTRRRGNLKSHKICKVWSIKMTFIQQFYIFKSTIVHNKHQFCKEKMFGIAVK
jgi:hypothetical protein